jgi:hypothetical protein
VAARSRGWLEFWNDVVGLPGFYPFDLLAAAYVLEPERFHCADSATWIAPAPDLAGWLHSPVAVLVGLSRERPPRVRVDGRALYCPLVDPDVHGSLMRRLTRPT